ncbi:MAG: hypothetical protein GX892_01285 [Thermoanaerobacteraceae bacterium]|nr:hypothetical protein [Thermoanaerobacteraceae bacterium]
MPSADNNRVNSELYRNKIKSEVISSQMMMVRMQEIQREEETRNLDFVRKDNTMPAPEQNSTL